MSEIIVYNYKTSNLWLLFMTFEMEVKTVLHITLIMLVNLGSRLLNASSPKITSTTC